ncbi:MAG: hypothetical protein NTW29_19665 [Bacteroidetes bacterium]|nr:hypothetical protein [Bacteroidota bacterium]
MDFCVKDWIDIITKTAGAVGVLFAAWFYRKQVRLKQAEWLKSLFEKFFENQHYKEVRGWVDYGELNAKLNVSDFVEKRSNEERFTDFLNFFEFIGVLHYRGELSLEQVNEIFDYYLKKIKDDPDCSIWIKKFGFEKLQLLLNKI